MSSHPKSASSSMVVTSGQIARLHEGLSPLGRVQWWPYRVMNWALPVFEGAFGFVDALAAHVEDRGSIRESLCSPEELAQLPSLAEQVAAVCEFYRARPCEEKSQGVELYVSSEDHVAVEEAIFGKELRERLLGAGYDTRLGVYDCIYLGTPVSVLPLLHTSVPCSDDVDSARLYGYVDANKVRAVASLEQARRLLDETVAALPSDFPTGGVGEVLELKSRLYLASSGVEADKEQLSYVLSLLPSIADRVWVDAPEAMGLLRALCVLGGEGFSHSYEWVELGFQDPYDVPFIATGDAMRIAESMAGRLGVPVGKGR